MSMMQIGKKEVLVKLVAISLQHNIALQWRNPQIIVQER